ncbi:threonine/homoserine/homoserine lactone efflux protein [Nocardia tenerifensis]|uniref:Threonine/homoserine/homoserine lactone efflux protein n=1 Tax=Nocardia tenerifensis TaxID=228006 RepID=A0A318JVB8_9NOCA|nr:LysE family translocator [Nocardia tenerifensis]PXX57786.1 threonine/homoserine/homoserine lactone efflux protein [Nocardia tenerifensis]
MSIAAILGWVVVALVGVMTPGIDTLLVLRHTMLWGRRDGFMVLVGIGLGCLVWASASLVGLTALLAASTVGYNAVRIAGATYLLCLGVSALRKTLGRNSSRGDRDSDTAPIPTARGGYAALRAGALTNLLNPKVGVFYISLLPQFLPVGPGSAGWGILLVAIHLVVTFTWYPILISWAATARTWLQQQQVRRWLDRVTATVLIGLGVKLAAEVR